MTNADAGVVRKQIVVAASIERAFEGFTGRFGDFKPPEHNLLAAPITETVFEPRVGGNFVDRAVDGNECRWARILAYDPPDRVVFSWDIGPQSQIVTGPAFASEVEIRLFVEAADPGGPRSARRPTSATSRPSMKRPTSRHRSRWPSCRGLCVQPSHDKLLTGPWVVDWLAGRGDLARSSQVRHEGSINEHITPKWAKSPSPTSGISTSSTNAPT